MSWIISILIFLLIITILTSIVLTICYFDLEEYFLIGMLIILIILMILLSVVGIHEILINGI